MSREAERLRTFLASAPAVARVDVSEAKGSTPREAGAWMLVSPDAIFGTIGGGQLEFMAIDKARELIAANQATGALDIPLGPEIGQCCGGRVALTITLMVESDRSSLVAEVEIEDAARPHVYLFGGGHVGHALASALSLLPLHVVVVETRAEALDGMPDAMETKLTPVPEESVRDAPAGSAFVVLTHDHSLDFLIVAEALKRSDAAYVGMIGSKTKKATFKSWYFKEAGGSDTDFARLISPIGGAAVKDKRPAVIAAMTAAEVMRAVLAIAPIKPRDRAAGLPAFP